MIMIMIMIIIINIIIVIIIIIICRVFSRVLILYPSSIGNYSPPSDLGTVLSLLRVQSRISANTLALLQWELAVQIHLHCENLHSVLQIIIEGTAVGQ